MKNKKIDLLDTTLRDGSQSAGISLSVQDKIKIAKALDDFGITYIEGGWPGSNPKDELFFKEAQKIKFKNSMLVAFGSTRRKGIKASEDGNIQALLKSKVKGVCLFGKSWDLHVTQALRTTNEENLEMISDSVSFLKSKGIKVIYDAEHFFDGFKNNKDYAMATLKAASDAGAVNLCLCETNGGMLPHEVQQIVRYVKKEVPNIPLGIHAHNDADCAVGNSIIAVEEGATLVQGTMNGLGERCGNADLCSIIPALQLRLGYRCVSDKNILKLTELSRYFYEIVNVIPRDNQPYVGLNAFAHKGGIHVSAVQRESKTYEHIRPQQVGNERRILVSELSGRSNISSKANELSLDIEKDPKAVAKIIDIVKRLEHEGYQFEDASGSFSLLTNKALGKYKPSFELKGFKVSVEKEENGHMISEATIKLKVGDKEEHTVAEGDGPVNALDNSLRKALKKFYPEIKEVSLSDFKVRVINAGASTAAKVRVLVESKDSKSSWGTIGVSENIIEASWQALADALEYKLMKDKIKRKK
ncbi:citramalate synthase [Elusimicrobiota bacterium]